MPSWLEGKPFALTVAVLFVIVLLRAQGTYWLGRGVTAGALHTRFAARFNGPRTTKAIDSLQRWGLPVVTVSFLTIGFQTVVNAAAGLIRMPWIRYTVAMLIGCVAWAVLYATVGIAAVEASLALAAHAPWALVGALAAVLILTPAMVAVRRRRAGGKNVLALATRTGPSAHRTAPDPVVESVTISWSEPPPPGR